MYPSWILFAIKFAILCLHLCHDELLESLIRLLLSYEDAPLILGDLFF